MNYLVPYTKAPGPQIIDRGHPLLQGCVFWARMWEGAGAPRDEIHGTPGSLTAGTSVWENYLGGMSTKYDGSTYYSYGSPNYLRLTEAVTCAGWVYDDGSSVLNGSICGKVGTHWKYILSTAAGTEQWSFRINTQSNYYPAVGVGGGLNFMHIGWNHIVGTYDRHNIVLYINGTYSNSTAYTTAIIDNANPFSIGSRGDGSFKLSNTNLGEVRVYNRALSSDEVLALYFNPHAGVMSQRYSYVGPSAPPAGGNTHHIHLPLLGVG